MIEGLDDGNARLHAAIEGIVDPEHRLRILVRTHLGTLLEGDCRSPLLVSETRALDAAARAEIAQAFDRYQVPWQQTLDELEKAGKLASAAPPVRLLLFGMLNWTSHWYRADGDLSVDELADAAVAMLLHAPRAESTNRANR
jgi:AcrR family transcriptional regulator